LLRGVYPRAARSADPGARNDTENARHCEERSDEAIPSRRPTAAATLWSATLSNVSAAIVIVPLGGGGALDRCETVLEIIGFDRRHKGVDDPGNGFAFVGGDDAVGEGGSDRLDRRRDVG
jgi:hypothetical protein